MELEQASLLVLTIKLKRNGWVCRCHWIDTWCHKPLKVPRPCISSISASSIWEGREPRWDTPHACENILSALCGQLILVQFQEGLPLWLVLVTLDHFWAGLPPYPPLPLNHDDALSSLVMLCILPHRLAVGPWYLWRNCPKLWPEISVWPPHPVKTLSVWAHHSACTPLWDYHWEV